MEDSILNAEDCKEILRRSTTNEGFEITETKLYIASKDQNGFFGDTHILEVFYNDETPKKEMFFVKVFPESQQHAEMAMNLRAYEKEIFFYENLTTEFVKLGYDTTFIPKYYYCKNDTLLVMEELMSQRYKNYFTFDFAKCKSCLSSLAKLHGASIMYEEHKTKLEKRTYRLDEEYPSVFEERFFRMEDKSSFVYKHFEISFKCLEALVGFMPEDEEYKKAFITKAKQEYLKIQETFRAKDLRYRKVCSHGDLWRRNIMFQDVTNDCRIVDFQMLRYHHPIFDVISMITFCTTKEVRKSHFGELLEYYYEGLVDVTNGAIKCILRYEDLLKTSDHFEFLAAYQAFAGHLLDIEGEITETILFVERDTFACKEFQRSERYRKFISDDIYYLYDAVFKNR